MTQIETPNEAGLTLGPVSRPDLLLGRDPERAAIERALAAARGGRSAVLVLRGEAGIGKTTLVRHAVRQAAGFQVVSLAGVEPEMELGYAGLHQLLSPFLRHTERLPGPQRQALLAALGLRSGGPPDRFLVGLATLTVLAQVAAPRPLLCVVDDAQWLDPDSAAVLAFAARRLRADAVTLLIAVREPLAPGAPWAGLPGRIVGGLSAADARQLFGTVAAEPPDGRVSERIVAAAGGNPLALVELAWELTPGQLSGWEPLPEPLGAGRTLEARYLRRVRCLPAGTQTLLLTAAADPSGDPVLLWQAGQRLGFGINAAGPAEAHELISFGPEVSFGHPLIRAAVYHGATLADRARVHQALAEVTDPATHADLRAWHRAEAATGPDEPVARELADAAGRAQQRGGWAATGAFLARAATLTPDPVTRRARVLAAAQAQTTAGAPGRAQALLNSVRDKLDDARQQSVAERVQGGIRVSLDETGQTTGILLGTARRLAPLDPGQARSTLLDALAAAWLTGRLAEPGASAADVARAARDIPASAAHAASPGGLLLDAASVLVLDGLPAAAPRLRQAVSALAGAPVPSADLMTFAIIGGWAAGSLGDGEALHTLSTRLERQARQQGALAALSVALIFSGTSALNAGALDQAEACFTERGAIEAARGDQCTLGQILVLAWRGRAEAVRAQASAATRTAARLGQGWRLVWLEYAEALAELSLGNYEAALVAAPHGYAEDPMLAAFGLPDLVEAAARSGRPGSSARDALEQLARHAAASPTPLTLGLLARSRALVTDGPGAESFFNEAISQLRQHRSVGQLARAHLLFGEWLRRRRRRGAAREQLRIARDMFEAMGAEAFSARARRELNATGDDSGAPRPVAANGAGLGLTAQEHEIAVLAAAGSTNAEIATQLFISPKTVDYHLGKIFRKLDVRSRRHIARAALPRA